ncbi:hypothetical protein ACT17_06395 [Mycolicibacterium conceptionense]|uniref:Uncharacterized protein n=1 Tax=Mycolicibacterium conceptionense TaxID=451644 RepID=A0A0J8UEF0_9MYCO|nr:hypothetical protein [Mycolicibacterium conceptionense]KMV19661.1 hypothetical protein ACT17_06395 [Mycolicibacterium conceptionense]
MTAPVDRIAAIIDEHRPEYGGGARFELFCSASNCDWMAGEEVEDQDAAHARHVAEIITGSADCS